MRIYTPYPPARLSPSASPPPSETLRPRLFSTTLAVADRPWSAPFRQPAPRPAARPGMRWAAELATLHGALSRRAASIDMGSIRAHVRVVGLTLALLSPVYGLIAWAVTGSVGLALAAPGVLAVAHITFELLRLTLGGLVYPDGAGRPQPRGPSSTGRWPQSVPPAHNPTSPVNGSAPAPEQLSSAQTGPIESGNFVRLVDQALRNLNDYAWLGTCPLAAMLGLAGETHVARGKALRHRLEIAIEGLRPAGSTPKELWPREWRGYAVLHLAYLEDVPNREIMARLYVAESTLARLRRKAVQAVAQSVLEHGG